MANKRALKKTIRHISEELFAEYVAATQFEDKGKNDETRSILLSLLTTQKDFISRVSHPEPGVAPIKYYNQLLSDFRKHAEEFIDQIENLC